MIIEITTCGYPSKNVKEGLVSNPCPCFAKRIQDLGMACQVEYWHKWPNLLYFCLIAAVFWTHQVIFFIHFFSSSCPCSTCVFPMIPSYPAIFLGLQMHLKVERCQKNLCHVFTLPRNCDWRSQAGWNPWTILLFKPCEHIHGNQVYSATFSWCPKSCFVVLNTLPAVSPSCLHPVPRLLRSFLLAVSLPIILPLQPFLCPLHCHKTHQPHFLGKRSPHPTLKKLLVLGSLL